MRVDVYFPEDNDTQLAVLTAFYEGLLAHQVNARLLPLAAYNARNAPDVAVVFGTYEVAKPTTYGRAAVASTQRHLGKDTIILKEGYIGDSHYAVGWNGVDGHAQFHNYGSPPDRLGTALQPYREERGENILLCTQVPWASSVQDTDHLQWLNTVVVELQQLTDRPIILRPHPKALDHIPLILGTEHSVDNTLAQDLDRAWAVVAYNSDAATQAALAGLPVFVFDHRAMAAPVANWGLSAIEAPLYYPREQWANDLAYAQWTEAELREGMYWGWVTERLWKAAA